MNHDNHNNPQFNQSEATSEANNQSEATSTEQPQQPAQRKPRLTDEQKLEKLRTEVTRLEQKVSKEKTQKKILLGSALISYANDKNATNPDERAARVLRIINRYITRDIDKQRLDDFVNELNDKLKPKDTENTDNKDAETEKTDNKDADSDTEKETVSNA